MAVKVHRPKQSFIPGTEPISVPAVDAAAEEFVDARDERMALSKVEKDKRRALEAALKAAKITKDYEYDGKIVSWARTEKARVRVKKVEGGDKDEDDDEEEDEEEEDED